MMLIFGWVFNAIAFAAFLLVTPGHRKLFSLSMLSGSQEIQYRIVGGMTLVISGCFFSAATTTSYGLLLWIGAMTISSSAFVVALTLKKR